MQAFRRGRYSARLACGRADLARLLSLRVQAFGRAPGVSDEDRFDSRCQHVLIEGSEGALAVAFRVLVLPSGAALGQSYAAQFYDLTPLMADARPVAEMGRFFVAGPKTEPDALRLAWAAMTRIVEAAGAARMLGCSSFPGTDWQRHRAALALLAERHLGPEALRPREGPGKVLRYPALAGPVSDRRAALAGLPPLLRTYLAMGGWVSDFAVADPDLDTLHVLTCVETAHVPVARAASLRSIAFD
jgi:putative hemolysin